MCRHSQYIVLYAMANCGLITLTSGQHPHDPVGDLQQVDPEGHWNFPPGHTTTDRSLSPTDLAFSFFNMGVNFGLCDGVSEAAA